MSQEIVRTIGKARVTIKVEGCVKCGVTYSPSWVIDRRHEITIGDRREYIDLKCCTRCAAVSARHAEHEAPTALQRRFATVR